MSQKKKQNKVLLGALELALNALIIFGLVFVIQRWIVAPFDVSGSSMCNTLNEIAGECVNDKGEKIIIDEASYLFNDPERGEIVVFRPEKDSDKYLIKRVIGLPGEIVEITNGKVYITETNGEKGELIEPYLNSDNIDNTQTYQNLTTFNVPEGKYFLLGDNRIRSTDSRSCFLSQISSRCTQDIDRAFVERELIRGRAWVVWWPLKNIRAIHHQEY